MYAAIQHLIPSLVPSLASFPDQLRPHSRPVSRLVLFPDCVVLRINTSSHEGDGVLLGAGSHKKDGGFLSAGSPGEDRAMLMQPAQTSSMQPVWERMGPPQCNQSGRGWDLLNATSLGEDGTSSLQPVWERMGPSQCNQSGRGWDLLNATSLGEDGTSSKQARRA